MEKFQAHGLSNLPSASSMKHDFDGKWITPSMGIRIADPIQMPPSPLARDSLAEKSKGKGKLILGEEGSELLVSTTATSPSPLSWLDRWVLPLL